MKCKFLVLLLLSVFSATSVYATESTADKTKDEQILGVLIVLNKNEIAAAKFINTKKVSPQVNDYAKTMTKQHGQNLQETMQLSNKIGKPIMDNDAKSMEKSGKDELATLKATKAQALQQTYIDDMVKDHEDALSTIDNTLLKNVTNSELKKHLEATREGVSQHLEKAKSIQDQLKQKS